MMTFSEGASGKKMKLILKCTIFIFLWMSMLLPVWGLVANAQGQKPGHELIQTLFELYSHPDYKVRQQAYFVSAGLPPYPELTAKLRALHQKADAPERAVIRYALAVITRSPEDIEAFLHDFPLDRCIYKKAFYPYRPIAYMVSQMQFFLRDLAYEAAYAERAKYLFWVAFYNPDMVHATTPYEDVFLDAYHEKHDFDEFMLKDSGECKYDGAAEWLNFTNVIIKPFLNLAQSDDVTTRSAAQSMVQFLDLEDDDDHCESYYKLATSKEELYTVLNSICRRKFNDELFLVSKEDVHNTFEFVKGHD